MCTPPSPRGQRAYHHTRTHLDHLPWIPPPSLISGRPCLRVPLPWPSPPAGAFSPAPFCFLRARRSPLFADCASIRLPFDPFAGVSTLSPVPSSIKKVASLGFLLTASHPRRLVYVHALLPRASLTDRRYFQNNTKETLLSLIHQLPLFDHCLLVQSNLTKHQQRNITLAKDAHTHSS